MWLELWGAALATLGIFAMVRHARTRPSRAREHPLRKKILDFVLGREGVRLTDIWKATGVSRNTVKYHLMVLQRGGAVDARSQNKIHWYFPNGHSHDAEAKTLLMLRRHFETAALIHDQPGITQQELLDRLHMKRKVFREIANRLVAANLVKETRDLKWHRYFPLPRLERLFPHEGAADAENPPKPSNGGDQA
jgi:predicted transcriptional regulator